MAANGISTLENKKLRQETKLALANADYVKPRWRKDRGMERVANLATHIFYRWDM